MRHSFVRVSRRASTCGELVLLATLACTDAPTAPGVRGPISMTIVSGEDQRAAAGAELPGPLVVAVTDVTGRPVQGQIVNFVVTSGGGHVFAGASISDADGRAQDWWTLGTDPGVPQTLEVRAVDTKTGQKLVFATFHASIGPSPVAWVSVTPCCFEYLVVGQTIQYTAQALDAAFKPLSGYTATWTSSAPAQVRIDQTGLATALASTPSPVVLTATIDGVEQPVKVYVSTAGPPAHIEKVSGDGQSGAVGVPLAQQIVARVTDTEGRLVEDAMVTWTPSGNGTALPSSSATDNQGLGRTQWTPGAAGANTLVASVGGQSVTFTATAGTSGTVSLDFALISTALNHPTHLLAPPGDPRLFIVEQAGLVRIIQGGQLLGTPFLDLRSKVQYDGGERGLLSMAFHPGFASNGWLFVAYTDDPGNVVVERYTVSPGSNVASPATAKRIIAVPHLDFGNHNGGLVDFGPDGKLYLGVGDGGGSGDPLGSGQNLNTLLGKLLRIDVDAGDPYAIPADNPFAGRTDAKPEIWAYGLRNPWRWTFDPPTSRLYIADVGQNRFEELDIVPATSRGLNFGWNLLEASSCFAHSPCSSAGTVLPILEYPHNDGCSITGGYVYRGTAIPELAGHYFYSDYCNGWVRSLRFDGAAAGEPRQWALQGDLGNVTSFGRDGAGELYVLTAQGRVYKIVRQG